MRQSRVQYCGWLGLAVATGLAALAPAQTSIDLRKQSRNIDFSAAPSTKPSKTGTALPGLCSVGETFFKTDATAGKNLYGCTSANTWTLLGSAADLMAGFGVAISGSTVGLEDSVVPVYYTGAGAPSLGCQAGRDFYTDTAAGALYFCKATNTWQPVSAASGGDGVSTLRFAQTAVQAGDSITADGTFASYYTIPAGTLQPGDVIRLVAWGTVTTGASGGNHSIKLQLGTIDAVPFPGGSGTVSAGANQTNRPWRYEARLIVVAAGPAAAAEGVASYIIRATDTSFAARVATGINVAFASDSDQAVKVYFDLTDSTVVQRGYILEIVR